MLNSSEIFSYIHVAYYGIFECNDPASKSSGVIMFRDTRIDIVCVCVTAISTKIMRSSTFNLNTNYM